MVTLLFVAGVLALCLFTGSMLGPMLASIGFTVIFFEFGGNTSIIANAIWNVFSSETLVAVPMFILLGELLSQSGLAQRIYGALSPTFERLPGKLLQSNVGTCTAFSAISGSSMATAAAVGAIAFRELEGRGYDRRPLIGSIAGAGALGMLIPPSVMMVIYGSLMNVSIGSLFLGGILPGLMMAAIFMIYIGISTRLSPWTVPAGGTLVSARAAFMAMLQAWPFLVLVFAILGTIFLGLATATESAALGVATVMILAALYRELSVKTVWRALRATAVTFGSLMLIIVSSIILTQATAITGMPEAVARFVAQSGIPGWALLILVYLLYFALGCVLDGLGMLLITLPIIFPLVIGLGYDPVWFGIVLVMLMEIGMLTPPLGFNLFVLMAIARGTLGEVARACVPYWVLFLGGLALVTLVPDIVLFLPRLFAGDS
ncbi:MAG: TRAP transporter large permease [Alphaproteobacteria bacterium]|nr:TRAP transporter large permease [Alphaproteobacteria bacterium]